MQALEDVDLIVNDLNIVPFVLDPAQNGLETTLGVSAVITQPGAADNGFLPGILAVQLGYRDVEFAVQSHQQGLETAAFRFE